MPQSNLIACLAQSFRQASPLAHRFHADDFTIAELIPSLLATQSYYTRLIIDCEHFARDGVARGFASQASTADLAKQEALSSLERVPSILEQLQRIPPSQAYLETAQAFDSISEQVAQYFVSLLSDHIDTGMVARFESLTESHATIVRFQPEDLAQLAADAPGAILGQTNRSLCKNISFAQVRRSFPLAGHQRSFPRPEPVKQLLRSIPRPLQQHLQVTEALCYLQTSVSLEPEHDQQPERSVDHRSIWFISLGEYVLCEWSPAERQPFRLPTLSRALPRFSAKRPSSRSVVLSLVVVGLIIAGYAWWSSPTETPPVPMDPHVIHEDVLEQLGRDVDSLLSRLEDIES